MSLRTRIALEEAGVKGYAGDCGEAAKAINEVFFDGDGTLVFAINKHVQGNLDPYIGHVACRCPCGKLWDANGRISEVDLRAWGFIDPYHSEEGQKYSHMSLEDCQDAELVEFEQEEERWTRNLWSSESKEKKIETFTETLNELEIEMPQSASSVITQALEWYIEDRHNCADAAGGPDAKVQREAAERAEDVLTMARGAKILLIDKREQDMLIAACRAYQSIQEDIDAPEWQQDIELIASNGEQHEAMSVEDVSDFLQDKFNIH